MVCLLCIYIDEGFNNYATELTFKSEVEDVAKERSLHMEKLKELNAGFCSVNCTVDTFTEWDNTTQINEARDSCERVLQNALKHTMEVLID